MRALVMALFLTVPLAATAAAQDRPAPGQQPADLNYVFEDHDVDGGRYQPQDTLIHWRPRGPRHSLVRPRVHFVPELLHSVERL
jgi:hypothetical protein